MRGDIPRFALYKGRADGRVKGGLKEDGAGGREVS